MTIPIVRSDQIAPVVFGHQPIPPYNPTFFDKVQTFFGGDAARPPLLSDRNWKTLKEIYFYEILRNITSLAILLVAITCVVIVIIFPAAEPFTLAPLIIINFFLLSSDLWLKKITKLKNQFVQNYIEDIFRQSIHYYKNNPSTIDVENGLDEWEEKLINLFRDLFLTEAAGYRFQLFRSSISTLIRFFQLRSQELDGLPLLAYLIEGNEQLSLKLLSEITEIATSTGQVEYAGRSLLKPTLNPTPSIDEIRKIIFHLNQIHKIRIQGPLPEGESQEDANEEALSHLNGLAKAFEPIFEDLSKGRDKLLSSLVIAPYEQQISVAKTFSLFAKNKLEEFKLIDRDFCLDLFHRIIALKLGVRPENQGMLLQLSKFPLKTILKILNCDPLIFSELKPKHLSILLKALTETDNPEHFLTSQALFLRNLHFPLNPLNEAFWLATLSENPLYAEQVRNFLEGKYGEDISFFDQFVLALKTKGLPSDLTSTLSFLEENGARHFLLHFHPDWLSKTLPNGDLSPLTAQAKQDLFPILPYQERQKVIEALSAEEKEELLNRLVDFADDTKPLKKTLENILNDALPYVGTDPATESDNKTLALSQIEETFKHLSPFAFAVALQETGLHASFAPYAHAFPPLHGRILLTQEEQ